MDSIFCLAVGISCISVTLDSQEKMPGKIDIPLKDNDEVIELDVDDLPDGAEALEILKQEQNHFIIWLRLAVSFLTSRFKRFV